MSAHSANAPPVEPRRFSIRLAQLAWILGVTIVLGLCLAAIRFGVPIYRQHLAIKEIERWQGHVSAKKRGPTWLRRWLGAEQAKILDEIQSISISAPEFDDPGAKFDDTSLAKIGLLNDVSWLNLSGTRVTDAGLDQIGHLKSLRHLDLSRTQITDAGLRHLEKLTNLRKLILDGTRISGSGLEHLDGLTKLEVLSLEETRVNDFQLVNLDCMTSLRDVWLTWSDVTEIGVSDAKRTLPRVRIHIGTRDTRAAEQARIFSPMGSGISSGPSDYAELVGEQIGVSDIRAVVEAIGTDESSPNSGHEPP